MQFFRVLLEVKDVKLAIYKIMAIIQSAILSTTMIFLEYLLLILSILDLAESVTKRLVKVNCVYNLHF